MGKYDTSFSGVQVDLAVAYLVGIFGCLVGKGLKFRINQVFLSSNQEDDISDLPDVR